MDICGVHVAIYGQMASSYEQVIALQCSFNFMNISIFIRFEEVRRRLFLPIRQVDTPYRLGVPKEI